MLVFVYNVTEIDDDSTLNDIKKKTNAFSFNCINMVNDRFDQSVYNESSKRIHVSINTTVVSIQEK